MSNYIRANFCLANPIQPEAFFKLFTTLEELGCRYNYWRNGSVSGFLRGAEHEVRLTEQEVDLTSRTDKALQLSQWMATPGYVTINMDWLVQSDLYSISLEQMSYRPQERRLSINVEDKAFFRDGSISYLPHHDPLFEKFMLMLSQTIRATHPIIGACDAECDLLCPVESYKGNRFPYWGNYFTLSALNSWPTVQRSHLMRTFDVVSQIDELGVLGFIHPLEPNQAWTARHQSVEQLLQAGRLALTV